MSRTSPRHVSSVTLDHLGRSLVWLVCCLPVLTIPTATAALFDVVARTHRDQETAPWWEMVTAFRRYLWRASGIGLVWAILGTILIVDLVIVARMNGGWSTLVLVALIALTLVYLLASATLFPVLVSFEAPARRLLSMTGLLTLLFPLHSLAATVVIVAAAGAVVAFPPTVLFAGSVAATLAYRCYAGAFARLPSNRSLPPGEPNPPNHPTATSMVLTSPAPQLAKEVPR